jgi:hypothetical protein
VYEDALEPLPAADAPDVIVAEPESAAAVLEEPAVSAAEREDAPPPSASSAEPAPEELAAADEVPTEERPAAIGGRRWFVRRRPVAPPQPEAEEVDAETRGDQLVAEEQPLEEARAPEPEEEEPAAPVPAPVETDEVLSKWVAAVDDVPSFGSESESEAEAEAYRVIEVGPEQPTSTPEEELERPRRPLQRKWPPLNKRHPSPKTPASRPARFQWKSKPNRPSRGRQRLAQSTKKSRRTFRSPRGRGGG